MNFGLIALLSLFGLAMGAATLAGVVPRGMELPLWLVIGIIFAIVIARGVTRRHFLHGFVAGALAGILSPIIQVLFFDLYLARNPYAAQAFETLPAGMSPRLFVACVAPVIALIYGAVVGLLSWAAARMFGKKAAAPA